MTEALATREGGTCARVGGSLDRAGRLAIFVSGVLTANPVRQSPRAQRPSRRRLGGPARVRPAALASLLILAGLLFTQLIQLSDLLLFPHYACEHGQLAHAHASEPEPTAAPSTEGEAPRATAAQAEGEHEHCNAAAVRHRELPLALHVPEATILGWIADLPLVLGSPRRPIALLAVAPKASPPRA